MADQLTRTATPVTAGSPGEPAGNSSGPEVAAVAADLEGADAEAIVAWTLRHYRRVAVVASFQAESIVLIDMASRHRPGVDVITLDTGRLPQETHDIIDLVRESFPITLHAVAPDSREIETMVGDHGVNLFYHSPDLRHHCCEVRKTRPLARALVGYDAWLTGLRRTQSASRERITVVARDDDHGGIAKVAPLAGWGRDDVWAYLGERALPMHALYGRGYTSIGCAPCTRAALPGEDERAGRWWWEADSIKECGLHLPIARASVDGSATVSTAEAESGARA